MPEAAAPAAPPLWEDAWWTGLRNRNAELWRGVEAQHVVATMKLVDDLEEQRALEAILEASKPPLPSAAAGQHFLIASPFRYPSPHGSRFRAGGTPGIWYGAEKIETACTELAHWRWRFLMDSAGLRGGQLIAEFTLFVASLRGRALDLARMPWNARRTQWTADDYTACHAVAREARKRHVQWIRYWSARDVQGHCGAVLDAAALLAVDLTRQQTWVCKVTASSAFMRHGEDALSLAFGVPAVR